jgi:hypothetical protein
MQRHDANSKCSTDKLTAFTNCAQQSIVVWEKMRGRQNDIKMSLIFKQSLGQFIKCLETCFSH